MDTLAPAPAEGLPLNARKPSWLRAKIPGGPVYQQTSGIVREHKLHTVCESAQCPNLGECWSRKTATIMILGNICTRSCGFCAVQTGRPTELDRDEPRRVAEAIRLMGLQARGDHVGRARRADRWRCVHLGGDDPRGARGQNPETAIEVLIPDFKGRWQDLETVLAAKPDILNHNVETVPRLHKMVRPQAKYERSLEMLRRAKQAGFVTKSGLMLGIGETDEEIAATLLDMAADKLDILTIGQYLRPSAQHLPMHRWVTPEEFAHWKQFSLENGFRVVESGPLVRSSYHADEQSDALVPLSLRPVA